MFKRLWFILAAWCAAFFVLGVLPTLADGISVTGKVVDDNTALPLSGVHIQTVGPTSATAMTDSGGEFTLAGLAPGTYSLQLSLSGYEATISEEFIVSTGFSRPLTMGIQRSRGSGAGTRVLARTTITASQTLQKSSVIYNQVSGNTLQREAITRTADKLKTFGAVDDTSSETASPGDDIHFALRGIGELETVSLLDGHPTALGISGGLNYEISPSFALRNVNVAYGAGGGDLYGVDAIGGVIDQQTLLPTLKQQVTYTQGWGTFDNLISSLTATGPAGNRFGYALALGVSSYDGPIKNTVLTQPAAAFDQTATQPSVVALQNYLTDTGIANRSELFKLRYDLTSNAHITLGTLDSYYWDNKTGNGDGDFLPYQVALAEGQNKLANYSAPGNPGVITANNPPDCPAGTFLGTNSQGAANGYGQDGVTPDGGVTCQTPAQFASYNSGWQGAGPAWQAFTSHDYNVRFDATMGKNTFNVAGFSNLYTQTYDRTWGLPFVLTNQTYDPALGGPVGQPNNCPCSLDSAPSWHNTWDSNAGFTATDLIGSDNNDVGFGVYYDNTAVRFTSTGVESSAANAYETNFFARDAWHPVSSPVTTYISAYFKHSTVTDSTSIDPRIAAVLSNGDDVFRASVGQISTQPTLDQTKSPFQPSSPGALAGNVNCTGLNDIGAGGNPQLGPERATDTEFSYGHRFAQDSTIQLSLYTEPVNNQIYAQSVPVNSLPPSYFNGLDFTPYLGHIQSTCGGSTAQAMALLGVGAYLNIGQGLAEGIDLGGRQRFNRSFFIDYDYTVNSSVPLRVPLDILQNDLTLIPGSQLPHIPLQKANFSLDYTFGKNIELRSSTYFVSANNPKNSPAYNYTNLQANVEIGRGTLSATINNLFQQDAFPQGMEGLGYPQPLNPALATPAAYTPYFGSSSTELFGLPFRSVTFQYSYHIR